MTEWEEHLYSRTKGLLWKLCDLGLLFLDYDNEVATFPLWINSRVSPVWLGYQEYRWKGSKEKRNHPKEGRYYTYVSKGRGIAYFGDYSIKRGKPLFIAEGIFEAIAVQACGYPCIAVLSNSTKPLREQLSLLPCSRTVALVQPDKASRELCKGCDGEIFLTRDADEYSREALIDILERG